MTMTNDGVGGSGGGCGGGSGGVATFGPLVFHHAGIIK